MNLRIVACHANKPTTCHKLSSDRRRLMFQKRRERLQKVFENIRKIAENELDYIREILDDAKNPIVEHDRSRDPIDSPKDLK